MIDLRCFTHRLIGSVIHGISQMQIAHNVPIHRNNIDCFAYNCAFRSSNSDLVNASAQNLRSRSSDDIFRLSGLYFFIRRALQTNEKPNHVYTLFNCENSNIFGRNWQGIRICFVAFRRRLWLQQFSLENHSGDSACSQTQIDSTAESNTIWNH